MPVVLEGAARCRAARGRGGRAIAAARRRALSAATRRRGALRRVVALQRPPHEHRVGAPRLALDRELDERFEPLRPLRQPRQLHCVHAHRRPERVQHTARAQVVRLHQHGRREARHGRAAAERPAARVHRAVSRALRRAGALPLRGGGQRAPLQRGSSIELAQARLGLGVDAHELCRHAAPAGVSSSAHRLVRGFEQQRGVPRRTRARGAVPRRRRARAARAARAAASAARPRSAAPSRASRSRRGPPSSRPGRRRSGRRTAPPAPPCGRPAHYAPPPAAPRRPSPRSSRTPAHELPHAPPPFRGSPSLCRCPARAAECLCAPGVHARAAQWRRRSRRCGHRPLASQPSCDTWLGRQHWAPSPPRPGRLSPHSRRRWPQGLPIRQKRCSGAAPGPRALRRPRLTRRRRGGRATAE